MLTLLANAKINLYLEIIGNRSDGFHELVMVMQSVALADRITLTPVTTPTIQVNCNHPQVPTDHTNLAYRAVTLLQECFPSRTNSQGGIEITLDKRIPVGAGLAGGSSNAAAVLYGLNVLWRLGLTRMELQELGAQLGSDVPFCLAGGCAIATGRGEEIDTLPNTPKLHVVLAKYQSLSVSTPWAYKTYRQQFESTYLPIQQTDNLPDNLAERKARVHSSQMVKALGNHDLQVIGTQLSNDLEKVILPAHPKVAQLKEVMTAAGQQHSEAGRLMSGTMMSGSGPTVFSLCETAEQAQATLASVQSSINDPDLTLFAVPFSSHGIITEGL